MRRTSSTSISAYQPTTFRTPQNRRNVTNGHIARYPLLHCVTHLDGTALPPAVSLNQTTLDQTNWGAKTPMFKHIILHITCLVPLLCTVWCANAPPGPRDLRRNSRHSLRPIRRTHPFRGDRAQRARREVEGCDRRPRWEFPIGPVQPGKYTLLISAGWFRPGHARKRSGHGRAKPFRRRSRCSCRWKSSRCR